MSHSPTFVPSERFVSAVHLACELHGGQVRKGTAVPYLSHLLGVASLVMEHGGGEDEAIAALLHDAVEDSGGRVTAERIRVEFGHRVADIVDACSDTDVVPKPPWRARKEAYLAHLRHTTVDGALLVSLADKVHNARSLGHDTDVLGDGMWSRFNAGRDDAEWYYRSLADIFHDRLGTTPLVHELDLAIRRIWG